MSLTKHPSGSLKELLHISLPLMLSSFSVMLMLFVDRILLARFSTESFNASVTASTLGWALTVLGLSVGSISEVFVAQYNGADRTGKLGEPVWQMMWFGLFSIVFYLPLFLWGGEVFFGAGAQRFLSKEYFAWMVLFGPFYAIYGALAGYFIGQGKTVMVSFLALATNVLNLFVDYILIFGVEGWVPSMGVKGAAIATSTSQVFQCLVLFCVFIQKKNRLNHGTGCALFLWTPFLQCMRIGLPGGVAAMLEIGGWAFFYEMMTWVGPNYILAAGICQTVLIMFFFFPEGLMKGATAVIGNLIGAKKESLIPQTYRNGVVLITLFLVAQLITFPLFVDEAINIFLQGVSLEVREEIVGDLWWSLLFVLAYLFFDGLRFLVTGVLMGAGDTLFLMVAGFVTIWVFLVVPVYILVLYLGISVLGAIFLTVCYAFFSYLVYYYRYKKGGWLEITLTA